MALNVPPNPKVTGPPGLSCPICHGWGRRLHRDCVSSGRTVLRKRSDGCGRDCCSKGSVWGGAFFVEVPRGTRQRLPKTTARLFLGPLSPRCTRTSCCSGQGPGRTPPQGTRAARAVGRAGFPALRTRCQARAPSPETAGPQRLCPVPSPGKPHWRRPNNSDSLYFRGMYMVSHGCQGTHQS